MTTEMIWLDKASRSSSDSLERIKEGSKGLAIISPVEEKNLNPFFVADLRWYSTIVWDSITVMKWEKNWSHGFWDEITGTTYCMEYRESTQKSKTTLQLNPCLRKRYTRRSGSLYKRRQLLMKRFLQGNVYKNTSLSYIANLTTQYSPRPTKVRG